jgi:transcriptional regulator with XRE-family HTH domain
MSIAVAVESFNERVMRTIRAEMAWKGVSQTSLANALGHTQNSVSRRLTGKTPLTLSDVEDIAHALDVPIDDLLAGSAPGHARRRRAS